MTNDERDKMIRATHDAVIVMVNKVNNHEADLYGNGKPGIKLDVDRLKGFKKRSCWIFSVIGVAVISLIGRLVYAHLTHP